jgi:DNA processing protein
MASVRVHRVLDPDYPAALRDLRSPPDPVWVRGQLLGGPSVAVVGTRHATAEALAFTHRLAAWLVRRGVSVWSGGALGVDAAAHRGTLDAGGVTVAVVPMGLEECYPEEHRALYDEIVDKGGALVSPFEPSQRAWPPTFHQRNAVLAALTMVTIVVQAPFKSGARSTAAAARRLRRPVFVVPSSPWEDKGEGNALEVALGAEWLEEGRLCRLLGVAAGKKKLGLGMGKGEGAGTGAGAGAMGMDGLSPACRSVFDAASTTPRHTDDLCSKTGLPTALVQEALLTLTLHAVLVEGPCGWFRKLS